MSGRESEVVDTMHLSVFVRLSKTFWNDDLNDTTTEGRVPGLLTQFPGSKYLKLSSNQIEATGSDRIPGVLGQFLVLTHFDLLNNQRGRRSAITVQRGVSPQCRLEIGSTLSGERDFELRGVVLFCRHLT